MPVHRDWSDRGNDRNAGGGFCGWNCGSSGSRSDDESIRIDMSCPDIHELTEITQSVTSTNRADALVSLKLLLKHGASVTIILSLHRRVKDEVIYLGVNDEWVHYCALSSNPRHMVVILDHLVGMLINDSRTWSDALIGREYTPPDGADLGAAFHHSSCVLRAGFRGFHRILTDIYPRGFLYHTPQSSSFVDLVARRSPGAYRIVAISDTHLWHGEIRLPVQYDILVHVGDLSFEESRSIDGDKIRKLAEQITAMSPQDLLSLFQEHEMKFVGALEWMGRQKCSAKIMVGGNHDYILEQIGSKHAKAICKHFGVEYLHESDTTYTTVDVRGTPISFWGSATTKIKGLGTQQARESGNKAFQQEDGGELEKSVRGIDKSKPLDILVMHMPPRNDQIYNEKDGSFESSVEKVIEELRPAVALFGHTHADLPTPLRCTTDEFKTHVLAKRGGRIGDTSIYSCTLTTKQNAPWLYPTVIDLEQKGRA
jgi:Icc-related predicted phosphoesterase